LRSGARAQGARRSTPATERLANWITQTDARDGPTGHT